MNKIVLFAVPGAAFVANVVESFESDNIIAERQFFYETLNKDLDNLRIHHDVDEIMVIGPKDFVEKIGKDLSDYIKDDNVTVYVVDVLGGEDDDQIFD